jgi:hypothetical protein
MRNGIISQVLLKEFSLSRLPCKVYPVRNPCIGQELIRVMQGLEKKGLPPSGQELRGKVVMLAKEALALALPGLEFLRRNPVLGKRESLWRYVGESLKGI